jgi:hypothetical protein
MHETNEARHKIYIIYIAIKRAQSTARPAMMWNIINRRIALQKCKLPYTPFSYRGKNIRTNFTLCQKVEQAEQENYCPRREPKPVVQFLASDVRL